MKKYLIIFTFFFSTILFSQSADKQIQAIVGKIYNFNFNRAEKELDAFSFKYKSDFRGYYYKSVMHLWYFLGSLNEAYADSFRTYSGKAASILDKIDDTKETEYIKKLFWLGMMDYNNSVIAARSNDFTNALVSVKNMKKRLSDIININPDFYDAYLGLGLSNFAFAEVPAALRWAANLIGFESDKELGLGYVQLVAEKGSILKTDAQFYLSQIYSRTIIDYTEAEKILYGLIKVYPRNLLFNYSYALVKYELNDLNSAERISRNVISSGDSLFPFIISSSHLLLGNIFFAREQYDSAIVHYNYFREKRVNNDYLGYANLKSGICYELLGNRKQAIKFYERTDEGNKDIDEDIYAEKSGRLFLQEPLSNEFKLIQKVKNLLKQKNYKEALQILDSAISAREISITFKAESYLLLCELNLAIKRYEEALENSQKCLKLAGNKLNEITANAYYYSALALYNLKMFSEAISYLQKIDELGDFDFQTSLKNKSYSLHRKINSHLNSDKK